MQDCQKDLGSTSRLSQGDARDSAVIDRNRSHHSAGVSRLLARYGA